MKNFLFAVLLFGTTHALAAGSIGDAAETTSHTSVGANEQEACGRAQSLASEDNRVAGPCSCETRGKVNVCRAESSRAGPPSAAAIAPKPQARPPEAGQARMISTASAPTREEACRKAQAMVGSDRNAGECNCRPRGNVAICEVQSTGPEPAGSVIDASKRRLRELARCNPADTDCKPHGVVGPPRG